MNTLCPRVRAPSLMYAASTIALVSGAAAAPEIFAPSAAEAQSSERIIVTARRREESVLELPASATAFTQSDIESAGITSARDYIALTPNITLVETQNAGTSFVVIRGITQARNSEPSVAVIIDGVQQTNPSQFTQELVDIQQIEVIRGPQGAIYGRNAIGGAINITTRGPTEEWESTFKAGVESGDGYNLGARVSGPLGQNAGFAGGVAWRDVDGYLDNVFLNEKADPVETLAGRGRLVLDVSDDLTVDLRGTVDRFRGRSLYFVVNQDTTLCQIFGGGCPQDINDTSDPIEVNNRGQNDRDIYGAAAHVTYETAFGAFTSTTAWDSLEEILTGDQWDFKPRDEWAFAGFAVPDRTQAQFLDVENVSQEFRFASPGDGRVRYSGGVYAVWTDRYISTGNLEDTGDGAPPVYREPRSTTDPVSPQQTFLADSQDNFAWAAFGDVAMDLNDQWELSLAVRYDEDEREQTTLTPPEFLNNAFVSLPSATSGEVRSRTFDQVQPKVTLRYTPNDALTLYGGYSKGFRSGGFNQSGVEDAAPAEGFVGVGDIFLPEVVDTYEIGFRSQLFDGNFDLNGAVFHTQSENSYYFVFLNASSTQNLGNVDEVELQGFELDGVARLTEAFSINFGVGFTDSEVKAFPDASRIGMDATLVSDYTANLGAEFRHPLGGTGLDLHLRTDIQRIGDTHFWDTVGETVRDPVDLIDLRIGVEGDSWTLTAWSKNLFDETYNQEYSPGGFIFKALPARYGVELTRSF